MSRHDPIGSTGDSAAAPDDAPPAGPGAVPRPRRTSGSRRRKRKGAKRFIKPLAVSTALAVVVASGGAWLYIRHLNANITKAPISAGNSAPPPGKADAEGRTATNILLIGTDSRKGLDGKYGDDSNIGKGNNDVDILLHVYPGNRSAVAVDLPRDTLIDHPVCTDPQTGQKYPALTDLPLNMALSRGGPGCVVDTVQKLTNLRINHFLLVNFQGVKDLTDAVHGVDVNLCQPIRDSESHLNLPAGKTRLDGDQALAFVRTRHAVQDGSAVGRFSLQRAFLAALFRQMTSAGTLLNPLKLTPLAEAATKALTVDPGIGSVTKLIGFAKGLSHIKPDDVAFIQPKVTYTPSDPGDPSRSNKDRLVQPQADQIFDLLLADKSVTGKSSPTATPTVSPTPTVNPSQVSVQVLNGTTRNGAAGAAAKALTTLGYQASAGNAATKDVTTSSVQYSQADQKPAAQAVAKALGLAPSAVQAGGTGSTLTVTIGTDSPTSVPSAHPAPTALPTDIKVHKANDTSCISTGTLGVLTQ